MSHFIGKGLLTRSLAIVGDAPESPRFRAIPIFVTSAKDPKEIAMAKSILDVGLSAEKSQFVPQIAGVHGSSTLREDQNPDGAEENWAAVKQFLARFSS
jgi:hypothetical protein